MTSPFRPSCAAPPRRPRKPTPAQRQWLIRAQAAADGKLPLFDEQGQQVPDRLVRACLEAGWIEAWFTPAPRRDWLVCRLTAQGRRFIGSA